MPPLRFRLAALLIAAACATIPWTPSPGARADDAVILANGNEIRGRIVSETDQAVKIDIGGGTMTFKRAQITEVRRDPRNLPEGGKTAPPPGTPVAPDESLASRREETGTLFVEGVADGSRTYRVRREPDGFTFEEELKLAGTAPGGGPAREVRTIERSDLQYRPVSLLVRESWTSGGAVRNRTTEIELRAGRLHASVAEGGEKRASEGAAPVDPRFPFAARELFLRESVALAGRLEASVLDPVSLRFRATFLEEAGQRIVALGAVTTQVRVVRRRQGETTDVEWVRGDLRAWMTELSGSALRSIADDACAAPRPAPGADPAEVPSLASIGSTTFAAARPGVSIRKPDPSWIFRPIEGRPSQRGLPRAFGESIVVVECGAPAATVSVALDPSSKPDSTPQQLSEAAQRACRTAFDGFRVELDGTLDRCSVRAPWFRGVAGAGAASEVLLVRVLPLPSGTYRLVARCPAAQFDSARADLEWILDSFAVAR